MRLDDLQIYRLAMELGGDVYDIVSKWDYFSKETVGKQLERPADSVAANISEGFGRYHFKEAKNFSYYARGSLHETKTWLTKAHSRILIEGNKYQEFIKNIDTIGIKLNNYIKTIGKTKK
jgi:four helix bundle protein